MEYINWEVVRKDFEKEMLLKLEALPGHREVPKQLLNFRTIISHELPETTPASVFRELIEILLQPKKVDLDVIKKEYLIPQLKIENEILEKYQKQFTEIKKSALAWVKINLPEERLNKMWQEHQTWLPRRYKLYPKVVSFQEIASDTLARYYLITYKNGF